MHSQATPTLDALRVQIKALETSGRSVWRLQLGAANIDDALAGGLASGGLHVVEEARAAGAGTGFCCVLSARLIKRRAGQIIWIQPGTVREHTKGTQPTSDYLGDDLYAVGIAQLGVPLERLLVVTTRDRTETAWVLEEALRCPDIAGVIADIDQLKMQVARRLQLAAEQAGSFAFLLKRRTPKSWLADKNHNDKSGDQECPGGERIARELSPLVSTYWRICSLSDASQSAGGNRDDVRSTVSLSPRWTISLLKCRGGRTGSWNVEVCDETGDFRVVSALGDGSVSHEHRYEGSKSHGHTLAA